MFKTAFLLGSAALAVATAPASAALDNAKTIIIGSQNNTVASPLQVAEVVATEAGTGNDVALGGSASATSTYQSGGGFASFAIDGNTGGNFGSDGVYHNNSDTDANAKLTITLPGVFSLASLTVYGRTDCCSERDLYTVSILNDAGAQIFSGKLDATASHFATVAFANNAVPEPATWAMMLGGFGLLGAASRRRIRAVTYA